MPDIDVDEIADEARSSFDMTKRLSGRSFRSDKRTVFTDEVTGQEHLEVLAKIATLTALAHEPFIDPETQEVLVEGVALDTKAIAKLDKERLALEAKLDKTALTFEWRAIPELIVDECRRKARKEAIVVGKSEDETNQDFNRAFIAYLLSRAVTRFKDHETGEIHTGLTLANAKALKGFLPKEEMQKLDAAYSKTQFTNAIALEAVDSPDF